ncbi:MAG: membrane protein insertase YidC [Desulfobacterales bacterium]|jgi:YidC/Oxa1 family membrane protein insertase|nr:membrane protein insertase YidC [Desulfobacterales bacterium]
MDQMRLMAALVLSFVVFFLWNSFFAPETPPKTAPKPEIAAEKMPDAPPPSVVEGSTAPALSAAQPAAAPSRVAREITVHAPLYTVGLSEKGAVINRFVLNNYRLNVEKDSPLLNLFPDDGSVGSLQLGAAGIPGLEEALFQVQGASDSIDFTEGSREVVFAYRTANGLLVEKIYRFMADSYVMGFDIRITNAGEQAVKEVFSVALREATSGKKSSYVFEGPSALINNSLETVEIGDIAKNNTLKGKITWAAIQTRYFMTGLIPLKEQETVLRLSVLPGNVVEARYEEPEVLLPPGTRQSFDHLLFFGPKSSEALSRAGHELIRVIDFGTFHFLANPLLLLMNWIYGILPNYGVAIIILTILTKVLLWPLGTKSYKSMSQMKKLQPLIQEIRQKYKNDRKRMNEEVMRLHRTYNINPLGGCLPMVLQIPVFFALYRMLDSAIELRHAHFLWWINDLSAPDRLFNFGFSIPFMEPPYGIPVLTLVMGATMFLQQKMTPPVGDPTQAKMMMLMPVVFTFIFINFSSGLVLYWLINNVLSIGQQYYTQKKFG